ncbi:MAG: AMP-binding protein [Bdellovibrionota bacterium]
MKINNEQDLQIWIHYYALKRKVKPNAVTAVEAQRGALIKIQDKLGDEGFSDLCPWPSLGDAPLEEELASQGPLYRRAIDLALLDLQARKDKKFLVSPSPVKNNILVADFRELEEGFDFKGVTVKFKGNEHVYDFANFLIKNVQRFKKIRIDFNNCISEFVFSEFLNLLSDEVLEKIEYIEDPFFFHLDLWNQHSAKVKLVLDWKQGDEQNWSHRIWKPSREEKMSCQDFSITSSMEHPVGVAHGLHFAQKYPEKTHGFLTLPLYDETEFSPSFTIEQDHLTYQSDGYGIGFTTQLSKLNWIPVFDSDNFLLCNHRASLLEKRDLFKIKKQFSEKTASKDFILIPSSGSTQNSLESIKIIALSAQALKNSAKRVNQIFNVNESSVWGCVLPLFHVGGLGILMRSHAAGSRICYSTWEQFSPEWINENCITHLSLVPTQIFEIVQKKWQAPAFIQKVFVGGAELNLDLAKQAKALGWPVVQTFGMTETASMIAVKKDINSEYFETLPHVEIGSDNGRLKIKSDSNASYILKLNLQTGDLICEKLSDWITTQDQAEISENKFKFLQRESDFVKIKGEGVSLAELRQNLFKQNNSPNQATICDLPDARDGVSLVLVVTPGQNVNKILLQYNAQARPYEKIYNWIEVAEFPVTELGKIKYTLLKDIIKDQNVKKLQS